MIIDIHAHLGDICFPGGGALIEKTGVRKKAGLDVISISEFFLHPWTQQVKFGGWLHRQDLRASMARNLSATRENFRRSMDAAGVSRSVALPVPPHVGFSDLQAAAQKDPAIIPFTGVDFSREYDVATALAAEVAAGAKGMKLHPILQREKLTSPRTFAAMEAFAPHQLPVLIHTGICYYYPQAKDRFREEPGFADLHEVAALVKAFPQVKFIAGHAGLTQAKSAMTLLGGFHNVWVEGSFQSPQTLRELIRTFGPENVLFGSDWPWGNRIPAVKIMKQACSGDQALEKRVLYQNAAELMNLSI